MSKPWLLVAVVCVCAAIGGAYLMSDGHGEAEAANSETREASESAAPDGAVQVEVVTPTKGGLPRTTTQPGSVIPDKSAELFAKVSGYLKTEEVLRSGAKEDVDIGLQVTEGELLAVIDVPELHKAVELSQAEVDRANADVKQAEAALTAAVEDAKAAKSMIKVYEASVEDAKSMLSYRTKVFNRLNRLAVQEKAVDLQLVDEKEEAKHAAAAAFTAAEERVIAARSQSAAAEAKVELAKADLVAAKAKLEVAQAQLQKDEVWAEYTRIKSPYTGVITMRNFWPGDFIYSREQGATMPLLRVEKSDIMRVKVQVPDADVPYVNPGDDAVVHIDALPGQEFPGTVSRIANAEDPETRTMRVEIDLDNDKNLLRDGMYGKVTITLQKASDGLTIPSAALAGELEDGMATVFVARNGVARELKVRIGVDDGIHTEIASGLRPDDQVILTRSAVSDGVKVSPIRVRSSGQAKATAHH